VTETTSRFEISDPVLTAETASSGPQTLSILGATGSIGTNTLDVVGRHPERFQIVALSAQTNVEQLAELARHHGAKIAAIGDESKYQQLKELLQGTGIAAVAGAQAIIDAASEPVDCVMAAIVGAAGLKPTFAAARNAKRVALANKECLVCAGELFMQTIAQTGTELLPVDSEHSGVFQCLAGDRPGAIEKITLTASGGPFRDWTVAQLADVTIGEALRHPNWSMGAKVTIDSATMMNKGLELIEAFHLFPVSATQLDAVVHPQSIVHCLVRFTDGSVLAQLAAPDMRTPIAHALAWPERIQAPTERLDLTMLSGLTFAPVDDKRFPAFRLARACLERGGGATCVLNAANEIAVSAFLDGQIRFLDIAASVEAALERADKEGLVSNPTSLDHVLEIDQSTRRIAIDPAANR
jgi:1-deoxy-D-xylulose-5-phosphate reductoisomerase